MADRDKCYITFRKGRAITKNVRNGENPKSAFREIKDENEESQHSHYR